MAKFFPGKTISKIHGTAQTRDGIMYFAMHHPAAALHQGNLRQTLKEDMLKLPPLLAQAKTAKIKIETALPKTNVAVKAATEPKAEPGPQQLSLF
jgi:DNA polymerase